MQVVYSSTDHERAPVYNKGGKIQTPRLGEQHRDEEVDFKSLCRSDITGDLSFDDPTPRAQ